MRWLGVALGIFIVVAGTRLWLHVVGASGTTAAPIAADVLHIALHRSEVPPTFVRTAREARTNEIVSAQDNIPLSVLQQQGRIGGVEVQYTHVTTQGVFSITAYAVAYRTHAGAEAGWKLANSVDRAAYRARRGYYEATSPQGDKFLQVFPCECDHQLESVFMLNAVKGRYRVLTEVHSILGTADPNQVAELTVHYADVMLRRVPA